MQPEARIVRQIQQWLQQQPEAWAFKVHGGPYQQAGVPDLVGCYRGRFIGLEVKTPVGRPSPLQIYTIDQIQRAGGCAGVVRSVADVQNLLGV